MVPLISSQTALTCLFNCSLQQSSQTSIPFSPSNSMANEEYSTPPLMKKRLFEYAPDSEEKFELKNNETKNHVLVVADANATLNTTCELETKQPTKTLTKKSKTNFNTINDDNNNNNNNNNNNKKKKSP